MSAPGAPATIRLPIPASRFAARARRLAALAREHAAGDWLRLLSLIALGQDAAVREVLVPPVPLATVGPPLAFELLPRHPGWQHMLVAVLSAASTPDLPAEASVAIRRLLEADVDRLETLAALQLRGTVPADELATIPFVGGALQAWFCAVAAGVEPPAAAPAGSGCPICGAPPAAGLVDGDTRLRWLTCSLCTAEWNVPRVTCTACGDDAGIGYFHVEGDDGAQAEACAGCGGYLKLFDLAKRPGAEPVADDAATLALDLLVAEEGYRRLGASPFLAAAAPVEA